jgi:polygalacturonase
MNAMRQPADCLALSALLSVLTGLASFAADAPPGNGVFPVRAHGAVGDGKTLDTKAIQAAIDACAAAGGGTVLLANGVFLSGTINLRDHVTLHLQAGAVLLASTRQADFTSRALIYAEKAENIAVLGRGAIDGHGAVSTEFPKVRSHPIHFIECKIITLMNNDLSNAEEIVKLGEDVGSSAVHLANNRTR